MTLFDWFKYFYQPSSNLSFTGGLVDTRTTEQKSNDIHFADIVGSAAVVNWQEKPKASWRKFPELNQYSSFTCGANALSKSEGIIFYNKYGTYLHLSRPDIYQRRYNRPAAGMAMFDMFRIAGEGVTLEEFTSSNLKTDADYETVVIEPWMKDVGKVFQVTKGIYLTSDIDCIASTIQVTGKGVILLTYFTQSEWSKETPVIQNRSLTVSDPSALKHFIVAPEYTLVNGTKCLIIEDSAHFGGISRRIMTEDWVKNRVVGAGYPMNFKFMISNGDKPTYDQVTVISTQECLRYEGMFPTNVNFAETVGPTTRAALLTFQKKYGLPQTQKLDLKTRQMLSQLYP